VLLLVVVLIVLCVTLVFVSYRLGQHVLLFTHVQVVQQIVLTVIVNVVELL
jgi:hypothetical protein